MALDVGVDLRGELVQGSPRPVPSVGHLGLHCPEEPLHAGIVRGAPLVRHGPGYAGAVADDNPLRPAVVASAAGTRDEVRAPLGRRLS